MCANSTRSGPWTSRQPWHADLFISRRYSIGTHGEVLAWHRYRWTRRFASKQLKRRLSAMGLGDLQHRPGFSVYVVGVHQVTQALRQFASAWTSKAVGGTTSVERLWRSVKYEEVYLKAYETVSEVKVGLGNYLRFYNGRSRIPHLNGKSPDQVYFNHLSTHTGSLTNGGSDPLITDNHCLNNWAPLPGSLESYPSSRRK